MAHGLGPSPGASTDLRHIIWGLPVVRFTGGYIHYKYHIHTSGIRYTQTQACAAISKKVAIVNSRIVEPKGTMGIVIMSGNAPAKVVTVWPRHYDEPALYILQSQW